MKQLTEAQQRLMDRLQVQRVLPYGAHWGQGTNTRTVDTLERLGLVKVVRRDGFWRVILAEGDDHAA